MARFVVETFVPDGDVSRFTRDVGELRAATDRVAGSGGVVRLVGSYLVPGDEMGFHVLEAPDAGAAATAAAVAGIDAERVVATIGIEPIGSERS